ncbi:MAG: tRNA(Glu)-specific nuclease WapA precursor [Microgenomates group bacterium ADurb.Bin238]|nr:MAG: tRNA(Glu)-specific nuclease WapA precursor [Microgenomates group bacterium ADurb.Bin238]
MADHLNISYQTLPNGIKEELILTKLPTTNTFSFTLDYSNLNSPKVLNNINAPVFYDQEGNYLFHFEKPFAYDSTGNKTDDATLVIKIDPDTNKYIAQLSVSQTWLSSPDRVYPVYIDPTIVHDTSSEFSGTLDNVQNYTPNQPSLEAAYLHDNLYTPDSTPTIRFSATDDDNDDINYQVQIYTDADFSSPTSYTSGTDSGFANITTPADTAPFNEGDTISFTFPTLTSGTTYFYRVRAIDPSGTNSYGDWSTTKSFTINTSLTNNAWHQTHADQFSSDTASLFINISDVGNSVTINNPLIYRTVTINNSGSQQSNYDALIELDTASLISAGKMQSDCDDIRFWSDSSLSSSLNYFLESGCNTNATQIWVRIPTLNSGDNVIYLSYNDSGASSGSQTWSGSIIVPTTSSTCSGSGTRVTALDGYYIKGGTTYGSTGGSVNHRHTVSGTTGYTLPRGAEGVWGGCGHQHRGDHTHTFSFNSSYTNTDPLYTNTVFCSYTSVPLLRNTDLSFFDSLPSGWTRNSTFDSRFMVGASTYGTTGGNSTHNHTYSGNLDNAVGGSESSSCGSQTIRGGTHNHAVYTSGSANALSTLEALPPYRDQIIASPDNNNTTIPKAAILMFNTATLPPYGWTQFTSLNGNFPRGNSSAGGTGGSLTHRHTFSLQINGTPSYTTQSTNIYTYVTGATLGVGRDTPSEGHTASGNSGYGSSQPPYTTVVFAQKNNDTTSKTLGDEVIQLNLISTKITGAQIHDANWHQLTFTDDETNGSITYQILYDNSGTPTLIPDGVLSGNSTGFTTSPVDLSSISKTTYPELYIKANFTYSGGAPILYDWTVTTNDPPNTPTLDSPTNGSKQVTILPTLKTTATDPESDYVRYKIELCTDLAMTQNCQTFDQTSSQTGWSGQNAESNTAYTSGTQASYTIQTPLSHNQTYFWRSYAIDPGGSNTWSDTQTQPIRFTTIHVVPPSECVAEVAPDFSSIIIRWVDNTLDEDSFELEKKINSGAFTNIQTTLPDITSYQDSTVSATNAYQYRVRTIINSDPSVWCTTAVLNLGTGSFQFEGLQLEGLQVH